MKPIIVVQNSDEMGYLKITKKELEEIINEAYEHGKAEANRQITYSPYLHSGTLTTYKEGRPYGHDATVGIHQSGDAK